jgi:alpha-ribazole phosphatase
MFKDTQYWLVRHAPVAGPPGVLHASDAPADLSDMGRIRVLKQQLPAGGRAFCSPARRTRETAAALGLDAISVGELGEQNFGRWTGRRHADIAEVMGAAAYRKFWESPSTNRPPDGESFSDQIERVAKGLHQLPGGEVILIVHSGTIRAVIAHVLGVLPETALQFVIDPLSLTRVDRMNSGWRIDFINRTCAV